MPDEILEQNQNQDNTTQQQPPANQEQQLINTQPANILQNQAYIESERERMRLWQENETLKANRPQERPNYDTANQQFFDKPAEAMARLVNEEVTKTIAPIAAEFRQFTRNQTYQTLKNQYRGIPNFNLIEATVDQIMANLDPTAANINGAISMAVGQLTLQGQNFMQIQTQPQNKVIPPNLPPSNPPAPNNQHPANKIQLTEMQRRVARENGMTDDDYIRYLTADAKEVITMETK